MRRLPRSALWFICGYPASEDTAPAVDTYSAAASDTSIPGTCGGTRAGQWRSGLHSRPAHSCTSPARDGCGGAHSTGSHGDLDFFHLWVYFTGNSVYERHS